MPIDREQRAMSCMICSISTVTVSAKTASFKIVIIELIENRIPDNITGIQNDLPTFKYLMVFRVFQPRTHMRAEMEANAMFEAIINQFTTIPRKYFLLRFTIHSRGFKCCCRYVRHKYR